MTPILDPANRKRIETFKTILADLKAGKDYLITRLTPIKSLCKDPAVAAAFTKYLASIAAQKLATRPRPREMCKVQWQTFQRLAIEGMAALESGGENGEQHQLLATIRDSQNVTRHVHWSDVRIIECSDLFQIELALKCQLQMEDRSRLAYDAARIHAEEYDPEYGTGLLPSSAQALEQIIAFWPQPDAEQLKLKRKMS